MKYQEALSALHHYIENFDAEEFSSSADFTPNQGVSSEQRVDIQKLKARLKRKRQLAESLHSLFPPAILDKIDIIITQEEVDALLLAGCGGGGQQEGERYGHL